MFQNVTKLQIFSRFSCEIINIPDFFQTLKIKLQNSKLFQICKVSLWVMRTVYKTSNTIDMMGDNVSTPTCYMSAFYKYCHRRQYPYITMDKDTVTIILRFLDQLQNPASFTSIPKQYKTHNVIHLDIFS